MYADHDKKILTDNPKLSSNPKNKLSEEEVDYYVYKKDYNLLKTKLNEKE